MAADEGTRRWRRQERAKTVPDAIELLRRSIIEIRRMPQDAEARRRLRAIAAEHELWEQLAVFLADEARASGDRPDVAVVFYEELADVYHALDQPLECIAAMESLIALAPDVFAHHERIAALYRQAGAWAKAADAFEQVALRAPEQIARAALLDAARLHRENRDFDRAAALFRRIVERRPTDLLAWRALDDVLSELGRWREVAEVRGERAARAQSGFEKAAQLRAQARALELAGDLPGAANVVARASSHAPEDVSGLVDQADVLARGGQGQKAVDILRARIAEASDRKATPDDVAALRMRLAQVLEDTCDDRAGANAVLDELLAAAPKHLPALERVTALAATDPDPRVHAAALLRYAGAVVEPGDRATYVAAAARRLRDVGDLRRAVAALAQAAALLPEDDTLQRELQDMRTASMVEKAMFDDNAGDLDAAERQLREVLEAQRHHVEANLALVDLMLRTRRLDAAAAHLDQTLGAMPEGSPPAGTARLVLRFAQVMAELGDPDESHQLLYEAHRLDRSSLVITLALGESCFARKLWRQAALHLGAAAAHPDAARQPGVVAAALVRAGQAETRALRGANASKHYEAAVKLDPGCTPAWHALAELAIERGDLARGAEYLEHEANATVEPKDRLRLFDALGDMALDVLKDRARAERCWQKVADAGDAAVLDKLVAVQRARGAKAELGETCARLARLAADAGTRKALLLEAADALRAGGAHERAVAVAETLLEAEPRDPDAIVSATTVAIAAGDAKRAAMWARRLVTPGAVEDTRAGLELVCAVGAPLTEEDERFLDANPPRPMASEEAYATALEEDERRELVDDPAERPLRDVLAILGEVLALVCPTATGALVEAGIPDAVRVAATGDAAAAAMYPQIARVLGAPPTLLYTTPKAAADVSILMAAPPVVLLGPRLVAVRASSRGDGHVATDAALRFQLGRVAELSRPHRVLTTMPDDAFVQLVADLRDGERLRSRLPVAVRQRLSDAFAALGPDPIDARAYIVACERAADRAGLLVCGDVAVAVELAGGVRKAPHLVRVAASKRYLAVRKKLRAR
ncbi:MAG TPA: tetratricopeptide repeat protein [Kofleriaceae bacterium]|nr:tetratricopeptide repeat protein [Kofleriaceae bacterium]